MVWESITYHGHYGDGEAKSLHSLSFTLCFQETDNVLSFFCCLFSNWAGFMLGWECRRGDGRHGHLLQILSSG
jgi:hypothetical protein